VVRAAPLERPGQAGLDGHAERAACGVDAAQARCARAVLPAHTRLGRRMPRMRRTIRPSSCFRVTIDDARVPGAAASSSETRPANAGGIDVSDAPGRRPLAARIPLVAGALQLEHLVGLHELDAQARLQQDGPNELLCAADVMRGRHAHASTH